MSHREQSRHALESFLTHKERDSDNYRLLTGAVSLREFFVVATSILGDLCDEVMGPDALSEGKFPSYRGFCEWARDSQVSESISDQWIYYWENAVQVFALYEELPQLSDWELYEEIVLSCGPDEEQPDPDAESLIRDRIIETCFAHSRWVRGDFR